jgi:virulence-associated protein VagC
MPSPFELREAAYPGFAGRPPARDLEAFLDATRPADPPDVLYATGIGALVALSLRARGHLVECPVILQGPVLWGLERRVLPRLVGGGLWPLLPPLFGWTPFQRRFVSRHFTRPLEPDVERAFFRGYAECAAAPQLFRWFRRPLLRDLEARFAASPGALEQVSVWWGGHDRVVAPQEQRWTETALGVRWASRTFPEWGHYPMVDDPEGWVAALA